MRCSWLAAKRQTIGQIANLVFIAFPIFDIGAIGMSYDCGADSPNYACSSNGIT